MPATSSRPRVTDLCADFRLNRQRSIQLDGRQDSGKRSPGKPQTAGNKNRAASTWGWLVYVMRHALSDWNAQIPNSSVPR